MVEELRASMPELPAARRQRYADRYGLPDYDTGVLLSDRLVGDYFEAVASAIDNPKTASNWVMTEVQRALNERQISMVDFPVPPGALAGLIRAQEAGAVNRQAARKVFDRMLETGEDPDQAIAALGLEQITDVAAIEAICRRVIDANPKPVADYRSGVHKALHALVGRVMRETRGKADPSMAEQVLRGLISG
jgi:aspartyl-tRNA(Asn)/glutamyl-tRNA(Gln) amidotransferase subunit B